MIKNRLLRKYFLLAVMIVVLFVVLGFFLTGFVARALRAPRDAKEELPPIFFAKTIDHLNYASKLEAVKNFKDWHEDKMMPQIILLDETGKVIFPESALNSLNLKIEVSELDRLEKPYDYFYTKGPARENPFLPMIPGPGFLMGGPGGPHGGPPGFGAGPRFHPGSPVILLDGSPRRYLLILPPPMRQAPQMTAQEKLIPFLGFGSLVLSLLIGIGATLFLIYISVFKRIKEADEVISELQKGNLKARFRIGRKDEFGEAMLRFNQMANEIEKLVDQMKFVELARTKLLQELAHDLRTPIAALKSLLETLDQKESVLDPKIKKEIIALSLRETSYFERLIEDLLLLSQVSEPNYGGEQDQVVLKDLLEEEVEDQKFRHQNSESGKNLEFIKQLEDSDFIVKGNKVLLQRMLKNIFTNAVSFAQSKIKIQLKQNDLNVEVIVEDDGPGLSTEQLQSFGLRKMSRQIIREKNNNERLSIGLGSVVIKKIIELHRGELSVENVQATDQSKTGARLTLKFKLK